MGNTQSCFAAVTQPRGEAFRLLLTYFTEQQHGQTLSLTIEYGYNGVLPLEHMPDYRLIQLVIEEALYVYEKEWVDVFWEMQNREVVRRLLGAFPHMSWVRSEMSIAPSELLPISRTSIVDWHRDDVPALPLTIDTFLGKATMRDFRRLLPDAVWYSAPPPTFNIGAPRYLLESLQPLHAQLAAVKAAADQQRATVASSEGEVPQEVCLSFLPICLGAAAGTYDEMLTLCESKGVYDALVLPAPAQHGLTRDLQVGSLSGFVAVAKTKELLDAPSGGVVEHLLHALLGGPAALESAGIEAASHAEARAGLFGGNGPADATPRTKMICEERFVVPLTLRGFKTTPMFDGTPLELCLAPSVAGTPRAAAAVEKVRKALAATAVA